MGETEKPRTEEPASASVQATEAAPASPKRPHKRGLITAAVIVAVVVVAGVGFWVWHEQPSFCNAICHSPMDYYVETYEENDPHKGITVHAENDVTCLMCHEATPWLQLQELAGWASDNYPMTPDGTKLATGKEFATEAFCAASGCHHELGDTYDEISGNLWGFAGNDEKYNPHISHQDLDLECGDCHGIHESNVLVCNECHNLEMPEGWEAPSEQ